MRGRNLPRQARGAGAFQLRVAIRQRTRLLQRYAERMGRQRRRARVLRKNGHARAGNPYGENFVTSKKNFEKYSMWITLLNICFKMAELSTFQPKKQPKVRFFRK